MIKIARMMFVAALALTFGAGAGEAEKNPNVKNRQIKQQKRIRGGAQSGSLTKPRAVRLQKNSRRIHRGIVRHRRDGGVVTPRERAKSQHRLNRQSRAIYREKNDSETQ